VESYRLRIKATAAKEIERIEPRKVRRAVVERILALAANPRPPGSEKLAGAKGQYRVRQGIWRILYEIREDELIVVVVKVGHRRDVYKRR
jgi:mRNA interferase RelE/StbE